jgi:hypothetical protein
MEVSTYKHISDLRCVLQKNVRTSKKREQAFIVDRYLLYAAAIATATAVFAITLPLVVDCCLPLLFPDAATATVTVATATAPVTVAVIHRLHLCLHCRRLHLQVGGRQRRMVAVGAMVLLVVDKEEARKGLF